MRAPDNSRQWIVVTLLILSTVMAFALMYTPAAALVTDQTAMTPLAELLNPDGTLKSTLGWRGSIDPRGWRLVSGPDEAPRFAPEDVPGDEGWSPNFSSPVNGPVYALVKDGLGNIYVGGLFSLASNVTVNNIAKWNGSSWSALGNGLDNTVRALAVDSGNNVYTGGSFLNICGNTLCNSGNIAVNYIAKWNGGSWSAMSNGFDSEVDALAVLSSTQLYAGGNFITVCGNTICSSGNITVNEIAQWNGSSWSAVGNGFDSYVSALAVISSTQLYAGGGFTNVCNDIGCSGLTQVNSIAQWNGSSWSAMSNGFSEFGFTANVSALAVISSTQLYAGGALNSVCTDISCSGSTLANQIAQWNGSSWSALGNGLDNNVNALGLDGSNNLYAGGYFRFLCGDSACSTNSTMLNLVAKWNGSTWSALSNGVNSTAVYALAVVNSSNIDAGGDALFAQWNGSAWSGLANGMDGNVIALAADGQGNVYAGGYFIFAGSQVANRIAKWNGSSWSALANGFDGVVNALVVVSSTKIYAGGQFGSVCGNTACSSGNTQVNDIAQWNGSSWSALSNGFNNGVKALVISGTNLIAGGQFSTLCGNTLCSSGNITVNRVAQWNGSSWSALTNGFNSTVYTLLISGTNLVAGGFFNTVCANTLCNSGNITANKVASWNGTSWSALGNGIRGSTTVYALAKDSSNNIYAGGSFQYLCPTLACISNGTLVNRIAKWNGSTWSALGIGFNSVVQALAVDSSDNLYAGGDFYYACGNLACNSGNTTVKRIAKWNGSSWSALGSGTDNSVYALKINGQGLFAGGSFENAGLFSSVRIGEYFLSRLNLPFISR